MLQINGVPVTSAPTPLVTIQLPVLSSSVDRSCECLGGESKLKALLQSESTGIQFQPPNYNSLHSPIEGHKTNSISFVFKIRRKKNKSNEPPKVIVVGKSVISYYFHQPSDYQFLPSSTTVENVSNDEYLLTHSKQYVSELIPRVFAQKYKLSTKNSKGKNILNSFETNLFRDGGVQAASSEDEDGEGGKSKKKAPVDGAKPKNASLVVIGFNDPVPTEVVILNKNRRHVDVYNEVKSQLLTILEFRPCIIRYLLESHKRIFDNLYLLAETINECCFTYKTGPFISSICPIGYNPTTDPMSRYFQSFRCKFPHEKLHPALKRLVDHLGGVTLSNNKIVDLDHMQLFDVSKRLESSANNNFVEELEIVCFGSTIKTQVTFQVCNLNDESLFQMISTFKRLPVCTQKNGWFLEYDMNKLRELSLVVIEARVQEFLNTFDPKVHRAVPRSHVDFLDKNNLFVVWQNRYSRIPDVIVTEHDLVRDKRNIINLKTTKGRDRIRRSTAKSNRNANARENSTQDTTTRETLSSAEYEGLEDTLEEVVERAHNRPAPTKAPKARSQQVEEPRVRQPTKVTPRLSKATTDVSVPVARNPPPPKKTAHKELDMDPNMNDILQLRGFDVFGEKEADTETSEEDW